MKNLLRTAREWVSNKVNKSEGEVPPASVDAPIRAPASPTPDVSVTARTISPPAPVMPPPARVNPEPTRKVRVASSPESTPPPTLDVAKFHVGPEIKLVTRGAKTYGVCPHCEAMWNVRERILHPTFRRVSITKGLTCPACDKNVSLPPSLDLRHLAD